MPASTGRASSRCQGWRGAFASRRPLREVQVRAPSGEPCSGPGADPGGSRRGHYASVTQRRSVVVLDSRCTETPGPTVAVLLMKRAGTLIPIVGGWQLGPTARGSVGPSDGASDLRRSEEHTSELQSLMRISYADFCLKKKKTQQTDKNTK